ncbi:hypothetical protein [Cypionkella sp.]|uniref:hypothetical protein n=1 Tax=Cypionkella sp. TaxID=2811411 RepID=UPI0026158B81|nr:hypothetical protein [Cypionkella sp.]MDB5665795.1 hypothetical protein [Cypionkella sp.]
MKLCLAVLGSLMLFCSAAKAEPAESKQVDGFMAMAILTPITQDELVTLWNTPRTESPHFAIWSKVQAGSYLSVVILVAGMTLQDGKASVNCNVLIHLPDGKTQDVDLGECLGGPVTGPNTDLVLAKNFGLTPDAGFINHDLSIDVKVRDNFGDVEIDLHPSVNIVDAVK